MTPHRPNLADRLHDIALKRARADIDRVRARRALPAALVEQPAPTRIEETR